MNVHLLVDCTGPLLSAEGPERVRMNTVWESAKKSGVIDDMSAVEPRAYDIRRDIVESFYVLGKELLKKETSGAEVQNDIYRLARAMGLYLDLRKEVWESMAGAPSPGSLELFWRSFAPSVKDAAKFAIDEKALAALKESVTKHNATIHIVTDNTVPLFRLAYEPVLMAAFQKVELPLLEYRQRSKPRNGRNCMYVSGEWGSKRRPATWGRIIADLEPDQGDAIVVIDDSILKLDALTEFCRTNAVKNVYPVLLNLKGEQTDYTAISSMEELPKIVASLAKKRI